MVAKDINEGGQGEVIIDGEVGVGDGENGEGGAVREIHGEERGGDDDGGELGELRHGGEEADEVVNVWRGGFRE